LPVVEVVDHDMQVAVELVALSPVLQSRYRALLRSIFQSEQAVHR
jgi:hypothetical protein